MINAELTHNPYLLQTSVKFNGQSPKINSQVEKYEHSMLKEWIDRIPKIFYDEMNGYDFDFNFVGTKSDFQSLQESFLRAGVTSDTVRLFHKNELEDAETKSAAIDALVSWLRNNPNRKFNFDEFFAQNEDLFEGTYPYVIINGPAADSIHPQVSMEFVEDASKLQDTDLTNTPVLIFVDPVARKQSREDLKQLLKRTDVKQNQLFFMVHPRLDVDQVTRVIMDLGVEKPQIVLSYDAEPVLLYIRNYPITEFVSRSIIVFNEQISVLSEILNAENKESEIQNAEIHAVINRIEEQILRLKEVDNFFIERDNLNVAHLFTGPKNTLREKLMKWRSWKTKVVGDEECAAAADDYDEEISRNLTACIASVSEIYESVAAEVSANFTQQYLKQGLDLEYTPNGIALQEAPINLGFSLADDLIAMKEITFEEPKYDLKALFRMTAVPEEKEPVRVATCYYAKWREKAVEEIMPVAEDYIQVLVAQLENYYEALATAFHEHLSELTAIQETEKEKVSAQLSDDERKLQEDNDWLADFKEKLIHIERD